ncbi:MAG: DNA topoisomerase VI subunit B [Candidatus Woesearchaeota archaeon]
MEQKTLNDAKPSKEPKETPIAQELAKKQRDIGVAEFFAKNRHLLGFDNKRKALMTAIKEAVDNSLDACEEANILPEIIVEVIDMQNDRFRVVIEDNGPGIVKDQIPKIFAKLLYGSKFHSMKQSRGQQGIGISAAVMYGQLTTGRAAKITSTIGKNYPSNFVELMLDTQKNAPKVLKEEVVEWEKDHGTRVEIDLEATYQKGNQSIDEYLKQTAITNPHATIIYTTPKAEQIIFARSTDKLPKKPLEIKPHPYGVELGLMQKMLENTESRTLQAFLTAEFSRVGAGAAKTICENSALLPNTKPKSLSREMIEKLMEGIKNTKLFSPPSDCISPIGAETLKGGLKKEIEAEFYTSNTRPPAVYRGNPFQIEVGLAYGGNQSSEEPMRLLRFANRVPLLFQQSGCSTFKAISGMNWRQYGLSQSQGSLPVGPVSVVIHIASVWVPFTSESKEAIAHYPEIIKEMRLGLQECGRELASYVRKKRKMKEQLERVNIFEKYLPIVAESIAYLSDTKMQELLADFQKMVKKPEFQEQINTIDEEDQKYKLGDYKEDEEEEVKDKKGDSDE